MFEPDKKSFCKNYIKHGLTSEITDSGIYED